MSLLFSNPELIRNARIQLRPGRMIVVAVICAVISITTWASIVHTDVDFDVQGLRGAGAVFGFILYVQVTILLIGGGIYCLQSVHREKELNTFDYQRVTRLSSFELAIGKLLGAPIAAYFAVLCLMPVALIAAVRAHVPVVVVFEAYVVLLLGSITYHALALLVSVLLGRGGLAVAIFLFLAVVGITYSPGMYSRWTIHSLSPFFAGDVLRRHSSEMMYVAKGVARRIYWKDAFLGQGVPHLMVFVLIHATFTAWFLLAVKRNLKGDPSVYEVYSPVQAFSFVLYLSFLMIGFFPWKTAFMEGVVYFGDFSLQRKPVPPHAVEQTLLQTSMVLFAMLALVLLRSRERVRLRARRLGNRAAGLWAALWPTPYLVGGIAVVGSAVVGLISHYRNADSDWNRGLAVYNVLFLAVWLARDALYLQWMNLRRSKRPLISAALYLIVFYGCVGVTFSALNLYNTSRSSAYTAILVPSPLFALNTASWSQETRLWLGAVVAQGMAALFFAWLHWHRLREFDTGVSTESATSRELPQPA